MSSKARFAEEMFRAGEANAELVTKFTDFLNRVDKDNPRWKDVLTLVAVNVLLEKAIEELNNG